MANISYNELKHNENIEIVFQVSVLFSSETGTAARFSRRLKAILEEKYNVQAATSLEKVKAEELIERNEGTEIDKWVQSVP